MVTCHMMLLATKLAKIILEVVAPSAGHYFKLVFMCTYVAYVIIIIKLFTDLSLQSENLYSSLLSMFTITVCSTSTLNLLRAHQLMGKCVWCRASYFYDQHQYLPSNKGLNVSNVHVNTQQLCKLTVKKYKHYLMCLHCKVSGTWCSFTSGASRAGELRKALHRYTLA